MSSVLHQRQPFVVIDQPELSSEHLRVLTQLYQPIIGVSGLSLYYTLAYLPTAQDRQSQRFMHLHLIDLMMLELKYIDEARQELEALELLVTYRDKTSAQNYQDQTIYYQLQKPLTYKEFISHPIYNQKLYQLIDDNFYQQLIKAQLPTKIDHHHLQNISTNFNRVHPKKISEYMDNESRQLSQQMQRRSSEIMQSEFDYSRFIEYLMNDVHYGTAVNASELTEELKHLILGLYELYHLSEEEASRIVHLSRTYDTNSIQIDEIPKIAKRQFKQRASASHSSQQVKTKKEIEQRKHSLQKNSALTNKDIELILMTEQMPPEVFLEKTKEAKRGFAESNERYYIRQLQEKVDLSTSIINLIIYQLLIVENQPSVYRNQLERKANLYLQEGLVTVEKALIAMKKAIAKQNLQTKSHGKSNYSRSSRQSVYVEKLPSWMQGEKTHRNEENQFIPTETELRQRLDALLNKKGDEQE